MKLYDIPPIYYSDITISLNDKNNNSLRCFFYLAIAIIPIDRINI